MTIFRFMYAGAAFGLIPAGIALIASLPLEFHSIMIGAVAAGAGIGLLATVHQWSGTPPRGPAAPPHQLESERSP